MFEVLPFDRHAVAARMRGLLRGLNAGDLAFIASRLGIAEPILSLSIDERSPHPSFETIAAIVRVYGVDPHWLMTGIYDPSVHQAALEAAADGSSRELEEMLRRQVAPRQPLRIVREERAG